MSKVFQNTRETAGSRNPNAKPKEAPTPPAHLAKLCSGSLVFFVFMMFWRLRREYPEFAMVFDEDEIAAAQQSLEYNQQTPLVKADAKMAGIVFRICDAKTGDMIVVNENNVADLEATEAAKRLKRLRDTVPGLVNSIIGGLNGGVTSDDQIRELCQAAVDMARA